MTTIEHRIESNSERSKRVLTLPRIEHPSKRFSEHSIRSMDVRGFSSNRISTGGDLIRNESSYSNYRRDRRRSSICSSSSSITSLNDRTNKTRLPIFGQSTDRHRTSVDSTADENEKFDVYLKQRMLKDKVDKQFNEVRRKFSQIANGNTDGKIPRLALHHLVASLLGVQHQIKPKQIDQLLDSLQVRQLEKISFDEFCRSLSIDVEHRTRLNSSLSSRCSTCSSSEILYSRPTARQTFQTIKEKFLNKDKDLLRLMPQLSSSTEENKRIYKHQFQRLLFELDLHIEEKQFDRLWDKFDRDGFHFVDVNEFKRVLTEENFSSGQDRLTTESQDQQNSILRSERRRHQSTFDEQLVFLCFRSEREIRKLEEICQQLDEDQRGSVDRDQLINVLREYSLDQINENNFDALLRSIGIELSTNQKSVHYGPMINRLLIKIKSKRNLSRINEDDERDETNNNPLIAQIEHLIRSDARRVHDDLQRLDPSNKGTLSSNLWKEFIEQLIEFALSPDEFARLKKEFPLDPTGDIRWKDFLTSLSSRRMTNNNEKNDRAKIPQWNYMTSSNIRQCLDLQHVDKTRRNKKGNIEQEQVLADRSLDEIRRLLKDIVRQRYKQIEQNFSQLDQSSYGELSKDLLHRLLQSLSIEPSITAKEIDLIWSNCHLKENGCLDFYQFLREFGYSKGSAHFPNAKSNPPKRGDADFLLTSRKLYGDSVLVQGTTLNGIKSNWHLLRDDFILVDPYRTGFVQSEEFDEIVVQCSPVINDEDLQVIRDRFQSKDGKRVNYVAFLKHYSPTGVDLTDKKTTSNGKSDRMFDSIIELIRGQVKGKERSIERAFKQNDVNNSSSISVRLLRKILDEHGVILTDDQFFFVVSELDQNYRSTIDYPSFMRLIRRES